MRDQADQDVATIQELYDASSLLLATLGFTHCTEDLLTPELDYATRRLIAARSAMRRRGLAEHVDAGLLPHRELPPAFNRPSAAVNSSRQSAESLTKMRSSHRRNR